MNVRDWCKTKPDARWQGRAKHFLTAFTAKNILIIIFVILVVVESSLYRSWRDRSSPVDYEYGPQDFMLRIGLALLPDALFTLISAFLLATQRLHPVTALIFSVVLFGLWVSAFFFNIFIAMSNEVSFDNVDTWYRLCYGEAGMQGIFIVLYAVMIGFASAAVHRWRGQRKRGGAGGVVEMERGGMLSGETINGDELVKEAV